MRWLRAGVGRAVPPSELTTIDLLGAPRPLERPDAATWLAAIRVPLSPTLRLAIEVIPDLEFLRADEWAERLGYGKRALADLVRTEINMTPRDVLGAYVRLTIDTLRGEDATQSEIADVLEYSSDASIRRAINSARYAAAERLLGGASIENPRRRCEN